MKCYKCDYVWEYKGSANFAVTCPNCMRKIILSKVRRLEEETQTI